MDTSALQLESRFSYAPNSLGYCGRSSANIKFRRCILKGNCEGVEEEITHFIVLYPYLKTMAAISGLSPFSHEVIESFWLGNDLLKKVKSADYNLLLNNFLEQNVPEWLVNELREKKPKAFIPTHLFQVLHVGVGRASGAVPFNLETINNCMIRWGTVESVETKTKRAHVKVSSLKKGVGRYSLQQTEEVVPFDPRFVLGLAKGSKVCVHWNWVAKILTAPEEARLKFWTDKVLEYF